jgi:F-type H+-transporting ATPase subunit delta
MSAIRIAGRYAKSLIDLAIERGVLTEVYNDMSLFASVAAHPEFRVVLKSPVINADKKSNIFDAIFGGKVNELTMAFLKILLTKGREAYLADIATEVTVQYKKMHEVASVRLTTAQPLSDSAIAAIRAKLEADAGLFNNIDLTTAVDADLIGGFTLDFDSKRYDASIANKVKELRTQFSTNLYEELI